jgi:hypothetical protein
MSKKAWDAGCWDDEGAVVLLSLPGVEVQEGGMIWAKKMTMAAPLQTQAQPQAQAQAQAQPTSLRHAHNQSQHQLPLSTMLR